MTDRNRIEWGTFDEFNFIDRAIERRDNAQRVEWLERYRNACIERANWDAADRAKVIQYLDDALTRFRMLLAVQRARAGA